MIGHNRRLTQFQNIIRTNRPNRVAQLVNAENELRTFDVVMVGSNAYLQRKVLEHAVQIRI